MTRCRRGAQGLCRRRARLPGALLAVSVWTLSLGCAVAAAGGIEVPATPAAEAGQFWTTARIRAAVPLEVTGPRLASDQGMVRGRRGKPHRVDAVAARASEFGSDFEAVADPTAPDYRVHGAIFMTLGIFGYARCSGTAVSSPDESVVITAGHCINSGGRRGRWFKSRWVFVPGFRFGQRPFGVFPARRLDTTRQWRRSGSENFDVGAAVVGRNERGQTLGEAVGGVGIAWNLKPKQNFDVHGYPAEEPFDGETQRVCPAARFLGHDPGSFAEPGPLNLAVDCEVTGGASGGGWVVDGDTLNGVTNYGYPDDSSPDYGAYFGKEVARLYGRMAKAK
jgi:V8-like Glu-specific endopeptidase